MSKQSLLNCDRGATLVEIMVATILGTLLLSLLLGVSLAHRRLYATDVARTKLNQNLRSSMDFLGTDIRQTGERLPVGFRAVEIIPGEGDVADKLVLRRNLKDEVLTICEDIHPGATTPAVHISSPSLGSVPSCVYGAQATSLDVWEEYRTENGGIVKAYLYDFSTQEGEFIDYLGLSDTGGRVSLVKGGQPFEHRYHAESSAAYLLVEWRYQLDTDSEDGVFQIIENQVEGSPINVSFGVTGFQVQAIMQDDSIKQSFNIGDSWGLLKGIQITLTGTSNHYKGEISGSIASQYFPRNVLSL